MQPRQTPPLQPCTSSYRCALVLASLHGHSHCSFCSCSGDALLSGNALYGCPVLARPVTTLVMAAYVDVSTYMISLLMCHLIWTLGLLSCASWPLPSDTGLLICSLSALIETSYRSVYLCQKAVANLHSSAGPMTGMLGLHLRSQM